MPKSSTYAIERAQELVLNFRQKFGEGHFWLACHAAFPLALTPELLYTLRANFLFDNTGALLRTPWIAVADVLLNLCKETGHELYQMEPEIRELLLQELKQNQRFQKGNFPLDRMEQLGQFLLAYVERHLYSSDESLRTFAEAQSWAALTYINPQQAAQKIATALAEAQKKEDQHEQVRLQILLNNLLEAQPELDRLRQYAQGNVEALHGNTRSAQHLISEISETDKIEIAGVALKNIDPKKEPNPTEIEVEKIQRGLNQLGYFSGIFTAKMDDATTLAVEAFLKDQEIDGTGKSLTFILREVQGAIEAGEGKKVSDIRLKVYLSNSIQLQHANNYRTFYRAIMSKLEQLENSGLIEFNYYGKHTKESFTDTETIDKTRVEAELTLMPINPDLIKGGLRNRKNIADLYKNKMVTSKSLVVPILLEDLGEYKADFAVYPQLPSDGLPLKSKEDYGRLTDTMDTIDVLINRLLQLKREDPEGQLNFEKKDYEFLYDASEVKKEEEAEQELTIYLSYAEPDKTEVTELVSLFGEDRGFKFVDPYFELEGVNYRDEEEERQVILEESDIVLAFLSPHYLASSLLVQKEFEYAKEKEKEYKTKLLPLLLHPCLAEWSSTGNHGGIPAIGRPFSAIKRESSLVNYTIVDDFVNITQKVSTEKVTRAQGQTPVGLWNMNEDFYLPPAERFPKEELGKTPKKLMIRYHPDDRIFFDRFVLHLKSLATYQVFDIDEQEYGISKIDPKTEQFYAIDRADVIINLVSPTFFNDEVLMESIPQISGNVKNGSKKAFNLIIGINTYKIDDSPIREFQKLTTEVLDRENLDAYLVEACMTLIEGLKETTKQEIDTASLNLQELIVLARSKKQTSLDLSNRQLKQVHKEIFTLPQLQELNLASNNLEELPEDIFKALPNLEVVNLADNQLTELSSAISNWQQLREINLSNNKLSRLPIELNLIKRGLKINVFNNPLPLYSKVIHDNPDDLLDMILTNQHHVKNMGSEEKRRIQATLSNYKKMAIDGTWGPVFFEALYLWQEENGLKPGALDKETLSILLSQSSEESEVESAKEIPAQENAPPEQAVEAGAKGAINFAERKKEIVYLIGEARFEKAFDRFFDLLSDSDQVDRFRDELVLISARHARAKNSRRMEVILQREYDTEINKIMLSLLNLLEEVEKYFLDTRSFGGDPSD